MSNTLRFPSRVGEEQAAAQDPLPDSQGTAPNSTPAKPKPLTFSQFGLSMIPLTPVPFTGESRSMFAYIRLGVYATASYLTFAKHRKMSYVLMAATATCLATSFLDGAAKKG